MNKLIWLLILLAPLPAMAVEWTGAVVGISDGDS